MIAKFRHKALRRLYRENDPAGLAPELVRRLRMILAALDTAHSIQDMSQPTFRLHPLKGELKGFWAVTARANWRVIFRFMDGDAFDVDFIDYH